MRGETFEQKSGNPELLPERLSVMIARSFKHGSNYAHGPGITADQLEEAINNFPRDRKKETFKVDISKTIKGWIRNTKKEKWLVGTSHEDLEPIDEIKQERKLYITKMVIVEGNEPTTQVLEEIYRQLENIPLPETPGAHDLAIGG